MKENEKSQRKKRKSNEICEEDDTMSAFERFWFDNDFVLAVVTFLVDRELFSLKTLTLSLKTNLFFTQNRCHTNSFFPCTNSSIF